MLIKSHGLMDFAEIVLSFNDDTVNSDSPRKPKSLFSFKWKYNTKFWIGMMIDGIDNLLSKCIKWFVKLREVKRSYACVKLIKMAAYLLFFFFCIMKYKNGKWILIFNGIIMLINIYILKKKLCSSVSGQIKIVKSETNEAPAISVTLEYSIGPYIFTFQTR